MSSPASDSVPYFTPDGDLGEEDAGSESGSRCRSRSKSPVVGGDGYTLRETAWYSWREWHDVYADVYSDNLLRLCTALLTMKAWKVRKMNVPVAVSGTMDLAQLVLADQVECYTKGGEFYARKPGGNLDNIHLAYAMAIVRLVNGLVDHFQTGKYARSVNQIAQTELGLPQWIVDIRHRATHDRMPSLTLVREGAHYLLEYLREQYWEVQANSLLEQEEEEIMRKDPMVAQHAICRCAEITKQGGSRSLAADVEGPATRAAAETYEPNAGPSTPEECAALLLESYGKHDGPAVVAEQLVGGFKASDGSFVGLLAPPHSEDDDDDWAAWGLWENFLLKLCRSWKRFPKLLFKMLCQECISEGEDNDKDPRGVIRWCRYLLSRQWHSLSEPKYGRVSKKKNLATIERSAWSEGDYNFMAARAPVAALESSGIHGVMAGVKMKCYESGNLHSESLLSFLENAREHQSSLIQEALELRRQAQELRTGGSVSPFAPSSASADQEHSEANAASSSPVPQSLEDFERLLGGGADASSAKKVDDDAKDGTDGIVFNVDDSEDKDDPLFKRLCDAQAAGDVAIQMTMPGGGEGAPVVVIPPGTWQIVPLSEMKELAKASVKLDEDENPCKLIPLDENEVREYFSIPEAMWKENMARTSAPPEDDNEGYVFERADQNQDSAPPNILSAESPEQSSTVDVHAATARVSLLF